MNKHSEVSRRCGYGFGGSQILNMQDEMPGMHLFSGPDHNGLKVGSDEAIDLVWSTYGLSMIRRKEGNAVVKDLMCPICGQVDKNDEDVAVGEPFREIRCDPRKHNTYYNTFQIGSE